MPATAEVQVALVISIAACTSWHRVCLRSARGSVSVSAFVHPSGCLWKMAWTFLDKRTQRLALRKALSHTMSLQPESLCRAETTELASRLHKLPHTKSDLNGSSALSKHAMKALKVASEG